MGIEWFMPGRYRARGRLQSSVQIPFSGSFAGTQRKHTDKGAPVWIGFTETEDDEGCICLGLHAFKNDDLVRSAIARLPTDVGR
jgi:hypothetical protein